MNAPTVCGLWPTPQRLVAVCVTNSRRRGPALSLWRRQPDAWAWLTWLQAQDCQAIVTTEALRCEPLITQAVAPGWHLWIAPTSLTEILLALTGRHRHAPQQAAALLARWPQAPILRQFLQVPPPSSPRCRQLSLL